MRLKEAGGIDILMNIMTIHENEDIRECCYDILSILNGP